MTSKYRSVPTVVDGIRFHSKKEAADYSNFALLLKNGKIKSLDIQVRFELFACVAPQLGDDTDQYMTRIRKEFPRLVGAYYADFVVVELDGTKRVYDSKGVTTPLYKLKKKLFQAAYPDLRIVEI